MGEKTGAAFSAVGRKPQRLRSRTDSAEDLNECDVEIAQPRVRGFLAAVVLLHLDRQTILQVPHLVRERAMLRRQQQCC